MSKAIKRRTVIAIVLAVTMAVLSVPVFAAYVDDSCGSGHNFYGNLERNSQGGIDALTVVGATGHNAYVSATLYYRIPQGGPTSSIPNSNPGTERAAVTINLPSGCTFVSASSTHTACSGCCLSPKTKNLSI